MKKTIGYTSEEAIDQRIASLEFKLWTWGVPLKEEKKMLAEMQELKRNRPKVSQVKKLDEDLKEFKADSGMSSRGQVKQIQDQIRTWLEEKRKVSEKMKELTEGRTAQLGDLPEQWEKRDKINVQIQEKVKERNELRDEFRQQEREFNAYLNERRQAARTRQEEERGKKKAEYEQRQKEREVEKLNEQPHVTEIMLIEQTIAFCKSLTTTKAKEEKKDKQDLTLDNPEGTVMLGKKEDRDEFWFAPTKEKKTGKKATGKESAGSKRIKHNQETFRLFDQLKLDAPITVDD